MATLSLGQKPFINLIGPCQDHLWAMWVFLLVLHTFVPTSIAFSRDKGFSFLGFPCKFKEIKKLLYYTAWNE